MKIDNKVIAGIIAVVGYVKYTNFINFINNLQLGLEILEIENGYIVANIKNLNTRHIPYSFKSIGLILNNEYHLANNLESSTNLSIVPFSKIPINLKIIKSATKEELEQSEIAIHYNFFGFIFKRLYKPEIANIKKGETIIDHSYTNKPKCGCKH